MAIEQEHLLLGADSRHAALDTAVLDHPRECGKIFQQRLHESLRLLLIHVLLDVMFSHDLELVRNPQLTQIQQTVLRNLWLIGASLSAATGVQQEQDTAPALALDRRSIQTVRAFQTRRRARLY